MLTASERGRLDDALYAWRDLMIQRGYFVMAAREHWDCLQRHQRAAA